MKRLSLFIALTFLGSVLLSSCGVMFGGSRYQGRIVAKDLPNATIYVNGEKAGTGTVYGLYYRNRPLEVEIKQEGCEDYKKTYHKIFRTGNFIAIMWGIIGVGIDLGTGASYKPDHINESSVTKQSDKNFTFTVEHPNCEE